MIEDAVRRDTVLEMMFALDRADWDGEGEGDEFEGATPVVGAEDPVTAVEAVEDVFVELLLLVVLFAGVVLFAEVEFVLVVLVV